MRRAVERGCIIAGLCMWLICVGGCNGGGAVPVPAPADVNDSCLEVYAAYRPVRVDVLPLTRLEASSEGGVPAVKVYVSMLDSYGCQIKAPAVFRFELYEYMRHSAEPKGQRIKIWPEIDLTELENNAEYWQDFMRSYVFTLDFDVEHSGTFMLQVTCIYPCERRLSAEYALKAGGG